MLELITGDTETKLTIGREKKEQAEADFQEYENDEWMGLLTYNKGGLKSLNNALLILQHDPEPRPLFLTRWRITWN